MLEENVFKNVKQLLDDVRDKTSTARNTAKTDPGRRILATKLRIRLESLVTLDDATNDKGKFLFSDTRRIQNPLFRMD